METKRQQKFGRQIQKDLSDIFQKEFTGKNGDIVFDAKHIFGDCLEYSRAEFCLRPLRFFWRLLLL